MPASSRQVEQVQAICREAAELNRTLAVRQGNVVVLAAEQADDVMLTADLHGHRQNFRAIQDIANLAGHPRRHLVLQEVCHGGPHAPGGGCGSFNMFEDVARLIVAHPGRVHFLLSNHELAELTDYPIVKNHKMLNLAFRSGLEECYGEATERVRAAYNELIASCPLAVRLPGEVFVCHSLPEERFLDRFDASVFDRPLTAEDFQERGSLFHLVWGRDYSKSNARRFAKLVGAQVLIHGHDPCPAGYRAPNSIQIILDCSATPAGYLIAPTDLALSHSHLLGRVKLLPGGNGK
jgi:hypothetical protein